MTSPTRPEPAVSTGGSGSTAPAGRDQSFPRSARLTRGEDYRRVLSRGARLAGRHLVLRLRRSPAERSRLGLTVSRKVGRAVARNRLRRRLREIFRRQLRLRLDGGRGPMDLVVQALPGATERSQAELLAELQGLLTDWERRPPRRSTSSGGGRAPE